MSNSHSLAPTSSPAARQSVVPAGNPFSMGAEPFQDISDDVWKFDPLRIFWFVIHYRWLIAGFLLAGIFVGYIASLSHVPSYKATAKIAIQTAGAAAIDDLQVVVDDNDWRIFETAREIMQSRELARRVVFKLNLANDQKFLNPPRGFSIRNFAARIFGGSSNKPHPALTPEQAEKIATNMVQGGVSSKIIKNSSILAVNFKHTDPQYAARIANQYVASFIDHNIDRKINTSNQARRFIEDRVQETKLKLQASERALLNYAKKAGITVTDGDTSLIAKNISDINAALSVAIQKKLQEERYYQQIQEGDAASLPEVFDNPSIHNAKQNLARLKATYQLKLNTLKPDFPEMRRLKTEILELDRQIRIEIKAIAKSVKVRYEQSIANVDALQNKLLQLDQNQTSFQEKNIQYTILKREVNSNRSQFDSLIAKLNKVGVGSELKIFNAQVIDPAAIPGSPATSPKLKLLVMSLGLFGALAAALIYLLELMNNTFAAPDQLESELKMPVLGIIPEIPQEQIISEFRDPTSSISEAHRTLRTSIQFTGTEENIKTILVTSSEKSEGKTTTAFKLAVDFATLGRRVLVIDADLRKPRMHRMFGVDNKFGLSNLLTNVFQTGQSIDLFRSTNNPNIKLLPSGTIPPNPTDILSSKKMRMTLQFCREKFDLVIIDSPPVMGLSDSPILASQADATLMIVSSKQVSRQAAKSSIARLRSVGANLIGSTLTKFAINKLDHNYAFQYMKYSNEAYDDDFMPEKLSDQRVARETSSEKPLWQGNIFAAFFTRFSHRFS